MRLRPGGRGGALFRCGCALVCVGGSLIQVRLRPGVCGGVALFRCGCALGWGGGALFRCGCALGGGGEPYSGVVAPWGVWGGRPPSTQLPTHTLAAGYPRPCTRHAGHAVVYNAYSDVVPVSCAAVLQPLLSSRLKDPALALM